MFLASDTLPSCEIDPLCLKMKNAWKKGNRLPWELLLLRDPFGTGSRKFIAYTVKLPSEQLAALQSIWLELKRLYGSNSPDKSGMIQQAVDDWLKRWDGPERQQLLQDLLEIRQDTRRRQYKKTL